MQTTTEQAVERVARAWYEAGRGPQSVVSWEQAPEPKPEEPAAYNLKAMYRHCARAALSMAMEIMGEAMQSDEAGAAAMVWLVNNGHLPTDMQALLIQGNATMGVPPRTINGALGHAARTVARSLIPNKEG